MFDINGNELREGGHGMLLVEIEELTDEGALVRLMNSDVRLFITAREDQVLGGLVASSELTAFEPEQTDNYEDQADGVRRCRME